MTHFNKFEQMTETATIWLQEIADDMEPETSLHDAYLALRAVLHMTRDRLPTGEAIDLSAQLPTLVRGIYFEHYVPGKTPRSFETTEEFTTAVAQHLQMENADQIPVMSAIRSVLKVLIGHIADGQSEQVIHHFPKNMRDDLFPMSFNEAVAQQER